MLKGSLNPIAPLECRRGGDRGMNLYELRLCFWTIADARLVSEILKILFKAFQSRESFINLIDRFHLNVAHTKNPTRAAALAISHLRVMLRRSPNPLPRFIAGAARISAGRE
jgi:hypothetical protein